MSENGPASQEKRRKPETSIIAVTDKITAELSEFKGKQRVDIRKWWKTEEGEWARSRNGLNMTLDEWNMFVARFDVIKGHLKERIDWTRQADSDVFDQTEAP